jgi:Zn-dependent protease
MVWIGSDLIMNFMATFIVVNFALGLFNLIPIYPLDGGRISKALLGMIFRDQKKARVFNGYLSLILSSLLFVVSVAYHEIIIAIFSLIFVYTSFMEIKEDTTKLDI